MMSSISEKTSKHPEQGNQVRVQRPLKGTRPNYEARVGLWTLIGVIMLLYGWGWLKSFSLFHPPQKFVVRFHDVAGLARNAPVNVQGVRVGVVENLVLKGKGDVECNLKIDTEYITVPQGSKISIQTLGLVGAKYVEITLPADVNSDSPLPAIANGTIVEGQDPVRIELYANKIATNLSDLSSSIATPKARESFRKAMETSGEAMQTIKVAAGKFNNNMDKLGDATSSIKSASDRFGQGASSADHFFAQGTRTLKDVDFLAQDFRGTSKRLNRILDNPALSSDLRDTVKMARETADKIQHSISTLTDTLKDKDLRTDLMELGNRLTQSTENISKSMRVAQDLAADKSLREDIKKAAADARDAMGKVNDLVNQPDFGADLKQTITKVRSAATNVDVAALQLNQILNKRAPLIQMMFGRPGKLSPEDLEKAKGTANKAKAEADRAKSTADKARSEAQKARDEAAKAREDAERAREDASKPRTSAE